MSSLTRLLERTLSPALVVRLRVLNRLRWTTKYRHLRGSGFWRTAPLHALAYLLLDPELESYTYELANEQAMIELVADAFAVDQAAVAAYCAEAHADPELGPRLTARIRWRPETKRHLSLGPRLLWYVLVRIRKPELVVETGVLLGLGSLTILAALDRNAADGYPGRLVSVDMDPAAGWLVPHRLQTRWNRVTGVSTDALPAALAGERVGILFQDTPHTRDNQLAEFSLALERAGRPLIIVDPSGGRSGALPQLCRREGAAQFSFQPLPRRHFHVPAPTAIGIFRS